MYTLARRAALWLLLLCFTSCGGLGDFYNVYIDPAFTPAQTDKVLAALASWERTVSVAFTPTVGGCSGVHTGEVCIHRDSQAVHSHCGENAIGCDDSTGHDGGEIWIDADGIEDAAPDYFQAVIAHEVGHAMGLHHNGPGNLMAPIITEGAPVPMCDDILQWYQLRGSALAECPE